MEVALYLFETVNYSKQPIVKDPMNRFMSICELVLGKDVLPTSSLRKRNLGMNEAFSDTEYDAVPIDKVNEYRAAIIDVVKENYDNPILIIDDEDVHHVKIDRKVPKMDYQERIKAVDTLAPAIKDVIVKELIKKQELQNGRKRESTDDSKGIQTIRSGQSIPAYTAA